VSAAHRGAASDPRDYYRTPDETAQAFARWFSTAVCEPDSASMICDPFAGDGAIIRALRAAMPKATLIAIEQDPALAAGIEGADEVIVADTFGSSALFPHIVTNPPYTRAREAVEWCLEYGVRSASLLLNSTWIGRRKSMDLVNRVGRPYQQHVLPRPSFVRSYHCKAVAGGCGHRWQTPKHERSLVCPKCGAVKPYSCSNNNCEYSWFSWVHGDPERTGRYGFLVSERGAAAHV
jgi:hypothetical protein